MLNNYVSAKLIVQQGATSKQLHAFGHILQDIHVAGTDEVTQEALLLSEPISSLIYNVNDVIHQISTMITSLYIM